MIPARVFNITRVNVFSGNDPCEGGGGVRSNTCSRPRERSSSLPVDYLPRGLERGLPHFLVIIVSRADTSIRGWRMVGELRAEFGVVCLVPGVS